MTERGTRPSRTITTADHAAGEPRLFVAVPIAEAARQAIEEIVETIRAAEPAGRGVRWVRLDGLHLTLRFLGPAPVAAVPALIEAMQAAAAGVTPFTVRIRGAGSFPPVGRPRTLWLGIDDPADGLARLAARLDDALAADGWPRSERPFRPHLTLARADGVRAGPATAAALRIAAAELDLASVIERVVLFESLTGGGPARYVSRGEASLGQDGPVLPSRRPRVGLRNRRQGAPHTS